MSTELFGLGSVVAPPIEPSGPSVQFDLTNVDLLDWIVCINKKHIRFSSALLQVAKAHPDAKAPTFMSTTGADTNLIEKNEKATRQNGLDMRSARPDARAARGHQDVMIAALTKPMAEDVANLQRPWRRTRAAS